MKYCYIYCLIGFILMGCKEYVLKEYEDDPRLYFYKGILYENGQRLEIGDSIKYTFFSAPAAYTQDTVWLYINTMGYPRSYERTFKLEQFNADEEGAAIAGVHYIGFEDEIMKSYMVIPPDAVEIKLPVFLFKESSMDLNSYDIKIKFVENEHFKPGIDTLASFRINTTNMATKPVLWDTFWYFYFGEWGTVKMLWIQEYGGYRNWETSVSYDYLLSLVSKVKNAVNDYNATHDEPLKEADGTLVIIP